MRRIGVAGVKDVRECQCVGLAPGSAGYRELDAARRLAQHQDWRIREWLASTLLTLWRHKTRAEWLVRHKTRADWLEPRAEWLELGWNLAEDPHPAVRAAAGRVGFDVTRTPDDASAASNSPVLNRPLVQRLQAAARRGGSPALELIDDPVCQVRATLVRNLDPYDTDASVLAHVDSDSCHMRVFTSRREVHGPVGRVLPLELLSAINAQVADPNWDLEHADPALWHGTWEPDLRNTWVYLPIGLTVTGLEEPKYSYGRRADRPDGSAWLAWRDIAQLMGAYGPPRPCSCMRAYRTVLYYSDYDDWHHDMHLACTKCHGYCLPLPDCHVEALWDGQQWCVPVTTEDPDQPALPGEPVSPPAFLAGKRLIVANGRTRGDPPK
jgi:hypothetical protein